MSQVYRLGPSRRLGLWDAEVSNIINYLLNPGVVIGNRRVGYPDRFAVRNFIAKAYNPVYRVFELSSKMRFQ